jgi:hypothetical protein
MGYLLVVFLPQRAAEEKSGMSVVQFSVTKPVINAG